MHFFFFFLFLLYSMCSSSSLTDVLITVDFSSSINTISDRFLSFGIDTAQFYQNPPLPFYNQKVIDLAKHLFPAYLRVSGTSADYIYYGPLASGNPDVSVELLPPGYTNSLTPELYDGIYSFATSIGMDILLGINAGPGPRTSTNGTFLGDWNSTDASVLLDYTLRKGYDIAGWELGNEPDLWPFKRTGTQLAGDVKMFVSLLKSKGLFDGKLLIEPEVAVNLEFLDDYIMASSSPRQNFSFHFYPLAACSGNKPTPEELIDPVVLDKIIPVLKQITLYVKQHAIQSNVWLGETSSIVCRGEHGVSDTFVDGFQYLDQMGLIAQYGVQVQIRQTLVGYETTFKYSMIDIVTAFTYPNYWNTLLFKMLMGSNVLATTSNNTLLRAYAHCTQPKSIYHKPGAVTLLILNLSPAPLTLEVLAVPTQNSRIEYHMQAEDLTSYDVLLNGKMLAVVGDSTLPDLQSMGIVKMGSDPIIVDGHTYSFIVFPDAGALGCN